MASYIWLLFGLGLFTVGDAGEVKWPTTYTARATRISITSNIIEDYQIWRTKKESRIDYNHGAVKSIVKREKKYHKSMKYDIHPEAFQNQTSYVACYFSSSDKRVHPEDILPEVNNLEFGSMDLMHDKNTTRYEANVTLGNIRSKIKLWAFQDESEVWIPVRYESLKYEIDSGFKIKHEIWVFFEFSTNFTPDGVFNVDDYECKNNAEEVTMNSDALTKDLIFIDPENGEHVDHVFDAFKMTFVKNYANEDEHAIRKRIFQNRMRQIVATNNKNLGYKLSINQFSDLTPEEMKKYKGLLKRPEGKTGNIAFPYTDSKLKELANDLPDEYDARMFGLVSKIKNQETCGSCWTFGTTVAVEGALAKINGGRLLSLANQAIVDCAWAFGAAGCDGGSDNAAYEWMMAYGLPTEAEYGPYKNRNGECNIKNMTKTYPIRGYTDVTPLSVTAIKVALLNHGPLSVSVHATEAFMSYSSGIFYDVECTETELDHEVSLVGYGQTYGETFWILKNSWGPTWGIDGYMHISAKDNVCGVATEPTYVVF